MSLQTDEALQRKLIRFYSRYADEIALIKKFWELELNQLSLEYTYHNKLPKEALSVSCRVKSIESIIKKIQNAERPQPHFPTEVVNDLVGARITCWFIDDCYGIYEYINASSHVKILEASRKDYNAHPKVSGYRSIHCLAQKISVFPGTKKENTPINDAVARCEIQIRTKLQDSWADITHKFHYKAILDGVEDKNYESFMADIADRLNNEDKIFVRLRDLYQSLADAKAASDDTDAFSIPGLGVKE